MFASSALVILLFIVPCNSLSESDAWTFGNQTCPTWFVPSNNTCKCGSTVGGTLVKCLENQNQSLLLAGFCMTYNDSTGVTVVGSCPFNYHPPVVQQVYIKLPKDVSKLNDLIHVWWSESNWSIVWQM